MEKKLQIAVIGSAGIEEYPDGGGANGRMLKQAERIGKRLAEKDVIVITGGKGGIMESAAKGAKKVGGQTVGVISGKRRMVSNKYTDIEVATGVVAAGYDEFLLVLMSDALIVLGGGAGTLEEMAIAYRNGKPVIIIGGFGGWADKLAGSYLDERNRQKFEIATTEIEAVDKAIALTIENLSKGD